MEYEFIDGSEAIARASIIAGCNFFAGYPITPATQILIKMMRELPKFEGIAIQGEDEIASISMCIAAAMCGRKAMTATSGPGVSLYSENIGLAIMGEVPLVIVNVQRLGPATGGATTGANGDIQFMRWVTSGGLPMVILAPSSIESMFALTVQAFNIAEILRTPVFIATCKDMVQSMQTLELEKIVIPKIENRKYYQGSETYVPYKFDKLSDIPDFLPIGAEQLVRFTTSMHDEQGYLTKVPAKVEKKFLHLERKITENLHLLEFVKEDLQENAEILIIAYGVISPVALGAAEILRKNNRPTSVLIIETLYPVLEAKIRKCLQGVKKVVIPEHNIGLFAESIKHLLTPEQELISVQKVTGELLSSEEIISKGGLL